jgi:type IV pilus assembly protein PilM
LSRDAGIRQGIYQSSLIRKFTRWLDTIPHPLVACELTPTYVAAARWTHTGALDAFAQESIPPGALVPTAVESNLTDAAAVRAAVGKVFARLHAKPQEVAVLVPDAVIRVFVLHFDTFPRNPADAIPMLRWRLKKSVPFEAEETLVSFMRQEPREEGVDVVTGLARLRIVREYEMLMESVGMSPGVVISSTLAALPLLDDTKPALMARVSGSLLTTAIVRNGLLCGFRCIELPVDLSLLRPQALLDEIYPLAAYYQDSWQEGIALVRLAGLADRVSEFVPVLHSELNCPVSSLLAAASAEGRLGADARPLAERELDALIGWTLNRGA